MDSFAQQMLNEIERRCKAYQLSNLSIALSEEFNTKESENNLDNASNLNNGKDIDSDDGEPILNELNSDETEPYKHPKPETIYANSNVIKQNETYENGSINTSVPTGRKPALPPKPPNALRLSLVKPKGYAPIAIVNRKSPPGKKDPAEMSLKERLALFEKNKGAIVTPKGSLSLSVPTKQMSIDSCHTKHVLHTSTLIKTVNQQKPIICDIDIDSENDITPIICESKSNHAEEKNEPKINIETSSTPTIKRYDVTDKARRSASPKPPPPIRKTPEKVKKVDLSVVQTPETQTTETKIETNIESNVESTTTKEPTALKTESHIEGKKPIEKRLSHNDVMRAKFIHDIRSGSKLYGDLTPIVTTIAPAKMNPDETIGLNELHQNASNYSLLSDSNQYQAKEEDRGRLIRYLQFEDEYYRTIFG